MDQQHTPDNLFRKRVSKAKLSAASDVQQSVALTRAETSAAPVISPTEPLAAAPLVTTPGWHELAEDIYHSDPCPAPSLSSHVAMTVIKKSLMHAWRSHPKSSLFEPTIAGQAADRERALLTRFCLAAKPSKL